MKHSATDEGSLIFLLTTAYTIPILKTGTSSSFRPIQSLYLHLSLITVLLVHLSPRNSVWPSPPIGVLSIHQVPRFKSIFAQCSNPQVEVLKWQVEFEYEQAGMQIRNTYRLLSCVVVSVIKILYREDCQKRWMQPSSPPQPFFSDNNVNHLSLFRLCNNEKVEAFLTRNSVR